MNPPRTPLFPLLEEPPTWDDLTLLAATIFLEAEGEPDDGLLGVGYVIWHRVTRWAQSLRAVLFGPDQRAYDDTHPWEPFSAWNDDYRPIARARLVAAPESARERAWRAAAGVMWQLLPDPVPDAMFYLNVPLTKKIRGGTLPSWYDPARIVAVIGRHTFLREA